MAGMGGSSARPWSSAVVWGRVAGVAALLLRGMGRVMGVLLGVLGVWVLGVGGLLQGAVRVLLWVLLGVGVLLLWRRPVRMLSWVGVLLLLWVWVLGLQRVLGPWLVLLGLLGVPLWVLLGMRGVLLLRLLGVRVLLGWGLGVLGVWGMGVWGLLLLLGVRRVLILWLGELSLGARVGLLGLGVVRRMRVVVVVFIVVSNQLHPALCLLNKTQTCQCYNLTRETQTLS